MVRAQARLDESEYELDMARERIASLESAGAEASSTSPSGAGRLGGATRTEGGCAPATKFPIKHYELVHIRTLCT